MTIPQNDQTHSNNSSANSPTNWLSVFDDFVGLALKGLKGKLKEQKGWSSKSQITLIFSKSLPYFYRPN